MRSICVLGIGSPFGEDRIGWYVGEQLKEKLKHARCDIQIGCCDRPGIKLLAMMEGFEYVFIVDAVKTGHPGGTIFRMMNEEIDEFKCVRSTHDVGVVQALQLGRALNSLSAQIILYGIEILNCEMNAEFSPAVKQAGDRVVQRVENEILRFWIKT